MKKSFVFNSDKLEYELKVRKTSRWWWLLLLLLLPLLLLIRLEKTIYVKTVDAFSGTPVPGSSVELSYEKAFLYSSGHFFYKEGMHVYNPTNKNGVVAFIHLKYSVYSYIFRHHSTAIVQASNNCYSSDTLVTLFHSLSNNDTLTLKMTPLLHPIDFKVIDKDDGESLPGSRVTIISEISGKQYKEEGISDAAGRVVFSRFPKCGNLVKVIATLYGYYPDSIVNRSAVDLLGDLTDKRTLRLKPIRKPIEFFVKDCQTNQPIPNALVDIEFDHDGKKTSVRTNVDGIGKGVYDDARIISHIHLTARKAYYKDGELPGWHLVKDFINNSLYPPERRTICLVPEEHPITFINVDSATRRPLAGVINIVHIKDSNGTTRIDTAISNKSGRFVVSGIKNGDVISIEARYPPDYKDNTTKISGADGMKLLESPEEARTIPLVPISTIKPPRTSCRIFVSGIFISDQPVGSIFSEIYKEDDYSEYVGEGEYPDNTLAFPKSVKYTFDGIAIDKGTRVIIYSDKNFTGDVVLDMEGPAIINNGLAYTNNKTLKEALDDWRTKEFQPNLQAVFPPQTRSFAKQDMRPWSNGSIKIICNK